MGRTYKALAHRAGCIRKKYKLTPAEAAWWVLWLEGACEDDIPKLVELMAELKGQRYRSEGRE